MSVAKESWSSFDSSIAKIYLDGFGHPSDRSKHLMASVLIELFGDSEFHLADFGCGNGHLYRFFRERGLNLRYTGYDFSTSLLQAARERYADDDKAVFLERDIQDPAADLGNADIVLYSHVLETLEAPGASLAAARNMAPRIMIRFFQPPADRFDLVELRMLDVGNGEPKVPYLRRSFSIHHYNLLLREIACTSVDVHQVESDVDQVHILNF
ncbi:class I SAM-dependent methyltransferase [Rhizobium leguminosarum]|uniref:class I SAM-dependent methyltransferase n=1 Tax=Rhizobium leguminosarum TaxID=384 RepID=UPI001A937ACF|nr:class I SAM-dependent methyltransferase [Rhizobium leguminosarum]MBY5554646.1 class I SAM-dependent methyltransferase [Rhizobium leguminosarum]MBY5636351.1 class I SAM-dependent methyltransferase [Rhizobium leguminosarum]MBY5690003.1 class I SAM-dependent methyltransferase [Rhizobium leguminosarum]MBY5722279.1 class I SAM-dependent methyltransferase [Rhizobium leguminosarum]MBY5766747.1 class I SAM-dependent methyltransferase [Rhizobium leguminosarum]